MRRGRFAMHRLMCMRCPKQSRFSAAACSTVICGRTIRSSLRRHGPISVFKGETVDIGGRRITALPACHSVPCIGYLIDSGAASLAYSADTTYCEQFWDRLNLVGNLKYLLIENTFRSDNEAGARRCSGHMTARLLAQGLSRFERQVELYIVHMEAGFEAQTMSEVLQNAGNRRPQMLQRGHVFEL